MKSWTSKAWIASGIIAICILAFLSLQWFRQSQEMAKALVEQKEAHAELTAQLSAYKQLIKAQLLKHLGADDQADQLLRQLLGSQDSFLIQAVHLAQRIPETRPQLDDAPPASRADVERKIKFQPKTEAPLADIPTLSEIDSMAGALSEKNTDKKPQVLNLISSKGKAFQYMGEIKNGMAHGYGIGVYETGSIYKGEWFQNARHGKGSFTWADGEHYDGEYRFDKRHGFGIYTWKNGERYEGEWKDDFREGKGVIYKKNGKVKKEGVWEKDELK